MLRTRIIVTAAGVLWLAHAGVALVLGTRAPGPFLSDAIQLTLGGLLICVILEAGRRSEGMARAFWHLATVAYCLWGIAQSLSVYNDVAREQPISWITNLLFCFWFVPLAMAIFLDPEHETGRLDVLMALDFVQAVLVCIAAYVYFFYLPKSENPSELAHSVWAPYFGGYGLVASAFVLRSVLTHSRDVRVLFGRMGAFLALSGCVDALYYYGPGRGMGTGAWFDLLWSALLLTPNGDCRDVEAGRSSGSFPGNTAAREAYLYGNVLPDLPAAGAVHVAAHRARAVGFGGRSGIALLCVFERAFTGHPESPATGKRCFAPRGLTRRHDRAVEPQSNPGNSGARVVACRARPVIRSG